MGELGIDLTTTAEPGGVTGDLVGRASAVSTADQVDEPVDPHG